MLPDEFYDVEARVEASVGGFFGQSPAYRPNDVLGRGNGRFGHVEAACRPRQIFKRSGDASRVPFAPIVTITRAVAWLAIIAAVVSLARAWLVRNERPRPEASRATPRQGAVA